MFKILLKDEQVLVITRQICSFTFLFPVPTLFSKTVLSVGGDF